MEKNKPEPSLKNERYGPHERNVLDFWPAKSETPTPVVIYFHGGGFVEGNKSLHDLQFALLPKGVSAVAANYRFVKAGDTNVETVLHDGARVVQFVRSKAKEWNINPARIALIGSSAGGNIALWLTYHDDLADPQSNDPIEHFSSRVSCMVGFGTQTSNNPNFFLEKIGGNKAIHPSFPHMWGEIDMQDLASPEIQAKINECSAIHHVKKGNPPVFLIYGQAPPASLYPEETPTGETVHSAKFGLLLKEKTDPLGLECHIDYPGHNAQENEIQFLLRNLKVH